jgi:hypothetical protein
METYVRARTCLLIVERGWRKMRGLLPFQAAELA